MDRLMREHIESLRKQAFVNLSAEQVRQDEERLKAFRETSSEYLAALKKSRAKLKNQGRRKTDKPSVTISEKIENAIEPEEGVGTGTTEMSSKRGGPLYCEKCIESSLTNQERQSLQLTEKGEIEMTIASDEDVTAAEHKRDPEDDED